MSRTLLPVSNLVVSPARLPHAQRLSVGKLPFKTEQDPAVTEKHLQAILSQGRKVLVEAWVHEPQQLPQVHLEKMLSAQPLPRGALATPRAPHRVPDLGSSRAGPGSPF